MIDYGFPYELHIISDRKGDRFEGAVDCYATKADAISEAWSRLQELTVFFEQKGLTAIVRREGIGVIAKITQSDLFD